MKAILQSFAQNKEWIRGQQALARKQAVSFVGLPLLARAFCMAACYQEQENACLLLVPKEEEAKRMQEDLAAILGEKEVYFFPQGELLPYQSYSVNQKIESARLQVLRALAQGEKKLVVTTGDALLRRLPPVKTQQGGTLLLQVGKNYDREALIAKMIALGYQREKLVEIEGSFAVRGEVLDFFPPLSQDPIRLEFFDDCLESIRYFHKDTQRSLNTITEFLVNPAREILLSKEQLQIAGQKLQKELLQSAHHLPADKQKNLYDRYQSYVDLLAEGVYQADMQQFLPYFYEEKHCLLDYLGPEAIIAISEPETMAKIMQKNQEAQKQIDGDLLEQGHILPSFAENFYDAHLSIQRISKYGTLLFSYLPEKMGLRLADMTQWPMEEPLHYTGRLEQLKEDCANWKKLGYAVYATASTEIRRNRLRQLFAELQLQATIFDAPFTQGFLAHAMKMVLLSEKELLGADTRAKPKKKMENARKIDTFLDLSVGDYVVHSNHGIGRYLGVERLKVGDGSKDYLHIQYQGADKLYVPVDQLDMVQKYVGNDSDAPKLNRLGSMEWSRAKGKVRQAVADMAQELLALYSAREAVQRPDFGPDTPWQQEFEDSFPFEETADQLQAIAEIKEDMQKSRPMDRLLCGDVGYGKTEVALRAAFKAVMAGRQVAVLVPTTILAQQHLLTFKERLEGYPVNVAVFSRFTSAKEQKEIKEGLANGQIDIVIGTHKLLGKEVRFRNLGLLIIDEEQRFGVAHKEKIKTLKNAVDVLTLSATPIPRTLHMSLLGMRDMSIINTPPEDRQAVQTSIVEAHPLLLQEVINRELLRGGQIYFVHNRIHDIELKAKQLQELVPQASIAIAHGRMAERELEDVMDAFIAGNSDILLCTTIIESGLDIPNVNTLIVDDADHFGLAQLYQLRGRVGRCKKQAYAYFTYAPQKIMNEVARKRLAAIRDFTELGSGFKIAMRDMEIRGVGNLLGPQQHGHIAAVGFDMYCRLVEEEMLAQKGEKRKEKQAPLLELDFNAFLPEDYVEDAASKMEIYKKLAAAESNMEIDALQAELQDRFGKLPEPALGLMQLGKIKVLAQSFGFKSVMQNAERFVVRVEDSDVLSADVLMRLANQMPQRIRYKQQEKALLIYINCQDKKKEEALSLFHEFLLCLQRVTKQKTIKVGD